MKDEFATYHRFTNAEEMAAVAAFLKKHEIIYLFEDLSANFNISFADNEFEKDLRIKLKKEDFEKVDQLMQDFYKDDLNSLPGDYYLYSFSNEELKEVLIKRDEWGVIDFLLAQKLLKERGNEINSGTLKAFEKTRISQLAVPEQVSMRYLLAAYLGAAGFGILSGIMGAILLTKKALPDGNKVFIYNDDSRTHGIVIVCISVAISVGAFIKFFILR